MSEQDRGKFLPISYLAKEAKGTLTSAQVLALFTTPLTLVPAPGVGKAISVDEIEIKVNFKTTAYTGTNAIESRYTNASGAKVTGDIPAANLNAASTALYKAIAAAVVPVENAPIVFAVPTANPGAGDSTVTYSILYRLVSI